MTTSTWQQIAQTYKAKLDASIPAKWRLDPSTIPNDCSKLVSTCGLLTNVELEIVKLDATALAQAIAQRQYSAVQATTAYLKAAAVAQQALNCLTDYFPEEALERAAWLDAELERTGKVVGPLHGVPVSIKGIKGHELTGGFASWVGKKIPEKDGVLVGILRDAGAVFYVKTTNPQAIMHLECDSFLGPTVNPYGRHLTSGGSSGGEGAILGIGASALGVGTDIGGSIRNPAAINGVYGFKPTSIRLPKAGNFSTVAGQESIAGAIGPMARSARDMSLMYATVLATEPWKVDAVNIAMPYRPNEVKWTGLNGKPKVGVMWHDGVVLPQPPVRRALKTAVEKLKAAGWEVVECKPYRSAEAWELTTRLFFTEGGDRIKEAISATGEPVLPLTEWILSHGAQHLSALEVCELVQRRDKFRADHLEHFYASGVDVILLPSGPGPAPVLGTSKYWSYTSFYNLVDFPAGVLPTGEYVEESDVKDEAREYMSKDDEQIAAEYSPETFLGAPIPLQVAAVRWEDEKVLAAIEMIDAVLKA